jgi:hypothetical protein
MAMRLGDLRAPRVELPGRGHQRRGRHQEVGIQLLDAADRDLVDQAELQIGRSLARQR